MHFKHLSDDCFGVRIHDFSIALTLSLFYLSSRQLFSVGTQKGSQRKKERNNYGELCRNMQRKGSPMFLVNRNPMIRSLVCVPSLTGLVSVVFTLNVELLKGVILCFLCCDVSYALL